MLTFFHNFSIGLTIFAAALVGIFQPNKPVQTVQENPQVNFLKSNSNIETSSSSPKLDSPKTKEHLVSSSTYADLNTSKAGIQTSQSIKDQQQMFTLPSGAVIDANGKIIQSAPQSVSSYAAPQSQAQQSQTELNQINQQQSQNDEKINELMNEYYTQKNALEQQIVDIKSKYYSDLNSSQNVGATESQQEAYIQNLTNKANLQIEQVQTQEEQLRINYLSKIQALQPK